MFYQFLKINLMKHALVGLNYTILFYKLFKKMLDWKQNNSKIEKSFFFQCFY